MPAAIFNGSAVKLLKNILRFNNNAEIISGTSSTTLTMPGFNMTLPTADGASGSILSTNGSGTLSFIDLAPVNTSFNIGIAAGTTTSTNDSIKITSRNGTPLSSSNPGYILMASDTPGLSTKFTMTSDVVICLTGCQWGLGTFGDVSNYPLSIYAINDAGSLKWGVSATNASLEILQINAETTATSVTAINKVFVTSALSSNSLCMEVAWFKGNFDDTGGASEDIWTVQTGNLDLNLGAMPYIWKPFTPYSSNGFGTISSIDLYWRRSGDSVDIQGRFNTGTVSAVEAQIYLPYGLTILTGSGIRHSGTYLHDTNTNTHGGGILTTGGDIFMNFSSQGVFGSDNTPALVPYNATAVTASSRTMSLNATIRVDDWI